MEYKGKMLLEKSFQVRHTKYYCNGWCHGFWIKNLSFIQKHTFLHLKRELRNLHVFLSDEERFRKVLHHFTRIKVFSAYLVECTISCRSDAKQMC